MKSKLPLKSTAENLRRNGIKRKKLPKLPCSDKWKPPPPNVLKINTDGAYVENSHKGGWGYVLRNDKGEVLAAGAGSMQHISEAIHAKSLALLQAINMANELGCNRLIFETDAFVLKQAIMSEAYDNSRHGALFKEIKTLLHTYFDDASVKWCNRSCNSVAHNVASFGAGLELGSQQQLGVFPNFVNVAVAGDVPHCIM